MIDWDAWFSMVNLLALIAWVALIFLPRWPALLSGVLYLGVGLLCLIYATGLIGLLSGLIPNPQGGGADFTTIAGVQLGLARYDRSRVDGCWLDTDDIGAVTSRLLHLSYEQRAANPCIGRERADLVLAGCAILEEIRLAFPAQRIRVADRGLREGILTMLMKEDGTYGGAA